MSAKRYGWLLFGFLVVLLGACRGVSIGAKSVPVAYAAPCQAAPVFRMSVTKPTTPGPFTAPGAWLIINGESLQMTPVDPGIWGTYEYIGDVPYDGEVRFRYMFVYTTGTGVVPSPNNPHIVYGPGDSYFLRPMGEISWDGSKIIEVPDDFVLGPPFERPHRALSLETELPQFYSGDLSVSETLTVTNYYGYQIEVGAPEIYDRDNGGPSSEFTIVPVSGSVSFPVSVPSGGSIEFEVTYQDTADGSGNALFKDAGIVFPWNDGARDCTFGPIWADGIFCVNPS